MQTTLGSAVDVRPRRLDGWGWIGERKQAPEAMLAWLRERLGEGRPFPSFRPPDYAPPPGADLPDLGCDLSAERFERLSHSRGRGLSDLLRLRSAGVPALPDAVAYPSDDDELETLLRRAAKHSLRIIPWGGGTSVTGGVNVIPGDRPVVTVDLARFNGLHDLDSESGLAVFGGGTFGPLLEKALESSGLTLGHFPQSWQFSTLGGWIATRSAGQESLGNGRIEKLVAGLDVVAPAGRLSLPALPASAAGPDLRQMILGSEGRFGIITRATVRLRRKPEHFHVEALLLRSWDEGVAAARELVRAEVGLGLLRLSDGPETEVAMTVGLAHSPFASLVRGWLRLRGISQGSCLLLLGASGSEERVDLVMEKTRRILRRYRAASLGAGPGRRWKADRFHHPYLRDSLLDHGYATDTFETAAPWSRLPHLYRSVREALQPDVPVLCHVSHPYLDGASLYFTFFFRCPVDADEAIDQWAQLKRRATRAVADAGGTLSHHHGIGSWHAPWYPEETGKLGHALLQGNAQHLDPQGILNPHVLLDPADRLLV